MKHRKNRQPEVTPPTDSHDVRFLDLASSLSSEVDRQIHSIDPDVDSDIELAVLRSITEAARGKAVERFAELSAEEFAEVYSRLFGKVVMQAELEPLRRLHQEALARQAKLTIMEREASVYHRLDLNYLDAGEVLTVGLFKPNAPSKAAYRYANDTSIGSLQRELQVRLLGPENGDVEVIYDIWRAPSHVSEKPVDVIQPQSIGRIGTLRRGVSPEFVPALTLHAPLGELFGDNPSNNPQIIGYVQSGDRRILLDG